MTVYLATSDDALVMDDAGDLSDDAGTLSDGSGGGWIEPTPGSDGTYYPYYDFWGWHM